MKRSGCVILLLIAGCASTGSARSDAAPLVDAPADPPPAADAPPTDRAETAADGRADDPPPATTPIRGTGACSNVEIAYFAAAPSTIDRGAAATLSWDGRMARGCDLQPGSVGFGGGPLSWTVTPSSTAEYSLRCFGTACLESDEAPVARVTVTVR
jgi:hypothetical protein